MIVNIKWDCYNKLTFVLIKGLLKFAKNQNEVLERNNCNMQLKIDKNTLIGDVLNYDETTAQFFLEMGMHCLGCPSARSESLGEACEVHEVSVDELIQKLKKHLVCD